MKDEGQPDETPSPEPSKEKVDGWVERMARKSAGLEKPELPKESANESDVEESKRLWRLAGSGIQFAGTVGLFWFFGFEIDKWMGWKGGAQITLSVVAVVGSLYLLIKEGLKANRK